MNATTLGFQIVKIVGAVTALLSSGTFVLNSQRVTPVDRSQTISFYPVAELTVPPGAAPALRHARVANPKDWPATFYSVHPGGSCTSTLVGPRALLTAAHCAPNNASVAIRLAGRVYKGVCSQSDIYSSNSPNHNSADWALCLMESDVPVSRYEALNSDPSLVKIDAELLLTGFGCTADTGSGGNDGNYRIGEAKVTSLPSGDDSDIQTTGEVALCYGDSGGPAFVFIDAAKKRRLQVSVNSRVQRLENGKLGETSYLSSVTTAAAHAFFQAWTAKNHVELCGLNGSSMNGKCQK